ncbi:bis(5'-adenosyl)-triphosphatase enpp4 isoform X2 [Antennarius striatus]
MPNLTLLYSQGVLVEQLTNVFVTKTFPNHYSLVTGLYAESHGIVANHMYDPISHKHFSIRETDPMWWSAGQPLWLTAQKSGYKTATVMWPGSSVPNRTATHFFNYNSSMPFQERLAHVINWMSGDGKEERVMFAALYWEEPDTSGHLLGPDDTPAMSKVLKEVDDHIGLLISELKRVGLWGRINVLVTSDHGMAQCSAERLIRLDDCLHQDNYTLADRTPVAAVIPLADPATVYALLKKCHANMTAYLKEDIPDRLHYKNNKRIQEILLIADEGWTIIQRGDKLPQLGDHGYDNALPSMHPFLAATGPSFQRGYQIPHLRSVDIYPLMCHLLSVPPQPNNGTLTEARGLLAAQNYWKILLIIILVVGVSLLLTTCAVFSRLLRWVRPFMRVPVNDLEYLLE